jgi:PKD repeat protein
VTTFTPGTGQRLALLDLGACYPAGTTLWHNWHAHYSANWPGHFKQWDFYLVTGSSLADLAANEAAVDAAALGAGLAASASVVYYTTYPGFTDDTLGNYSISPGTNESAQRTFAATTRFVSLWARPYFNAVPWYTDDASTVVLGSSGLAGASSVACPVVVPVADFAASATGAEVGETITLTDLSTNTPTGWAWDFGDGSTSAVQNPTHAYAVPGSYDVTLTATNASGSDSITKSSYIFVVAVGAPDPAPPAGVLLEIYAAAPGAARWGVAKWGQATWSGSGWRDVTPYGLQAVIAWGSDRPELGILSTPGPASWAVDFYDPGRILDPANADGPYFGDLIPFLPIRVSHRGTIVRVGYATAIGHRYATSARDGYIRATDEVSRLANAEIPSDTALADTLYARAVDAIAAAGLSVQVATPTATDPAVTAWASGAHEWSAWHWIADAAQETLQIPIVDRLGVLTFRPWATPLNRARGVNGSELVDLQAITDYAGMFSVVRARNDVDVLIERRLTPPPRYGARDFVRDEPTLDAAAWAEAVLADRSFPVLRWVPGQVRPLTALRTEQLATIEAVELISLAVSEEDPPVFASGIVVGGDITIVGRAADEAVWRFRHQVAQTATEPLIETGGAPTDYLLRTGGGGFVYPTRGA